MKRIFTLFLAVLMVTGLMAQDEKPLGIIVPVPEDATAPVVDGEIDEIWEIANVYNIDKTFVGAGDQGVPTLGESGETTWKALWTPEGFYLLLTVTDDSYWPSWIAGEASYLRDKPEFYFDWNFILEDGLGCQGGVNAGHYQYAPEMTEANYLGGGNVVEAEGGYMYAFLVDDPNYVAEYFIPFDYMVTNEGAPADLTADVGFDVYICESDEGDEANPRRRAVWANIGADGNEAWANMDNCGIINFEGADPPIYIDEINLTVEGAITENDQTLQVMAEVLPEDASSKVVKWTVVKADGSAASATIDDMGVITPLFDEEIVVQAISADGFVYSNEVTVSISGQIMSLEKLNIIKDGFFDNVDSTGAPSSVWYGAGAGTFTVTDGVLELTQPEVATNIWDNGVKQWINIPLARKDEKYIFSFKAWAAADRTCQIKIEDQANGWSTIGACPDMEKTDGTSFWPAAQMSVTTVPTVYTFELTWPNLVENSNIQFNYQLGDDPTTFYIDSVIIIAEADLALIPPTSVQQNDLDEAFKVYPNPADTRLTVEFSTANTTVAIYNSVGIKMDEESVFGTRHTFDVSRYPQGLYFVKANDMVVKFVK